MNEKINLQDLSALLAEKAVISKKEAETFLREYFEVMNKELLKSGSLKIKDFGTFKLSSVEDRESINVTTGERVLIPAHYKIAFSPDKKLAETVNEPFALFETVEIEETSEPEELALLSGEDVSEESELSAEEDDDNLEKESIVEEEPEADSEKEPALEEEQAPEENPNPEHEPNNEYESLSEKQSDKEEASAPEKKSDYNRNFKNFCLNCHDYEAHRVYRKKYIKTKKKLNRLRVIIGILSVLLTAAIGYIVYLYLYEKCIPFNESSSPVVVITESGSEKDSISEDSGTLTAGIVPVEETEKKEPEEEIPLPDPSDQSKQITVVAGQRLTSIALEEYGNKAFWIYIYWENKAILPNPDELSIGMKIAVPPASKYGIDCNDPASVQKAKEMAIKRP